MYLIWSTYDTATDWVLVQHAIIGYIVHSLWPLSASSIHKKIKNNSELIKPNLETTRD